MSKLGGAPGDYNIVTADRVKILPEHAIILNDFFSLLDNNNFEVLITELFNGLEASQKSLILDVLETGPQNNLPATSNIETSKVELEVGHKDKIIKLLDLINNNKAMVVTNFLNGLNPSQKDFLLKLLQKPVPKL